MKIEITEKDMRLVIFSLIRLLDNDKTVGLDCFDGEDKKNCRMMYRELNALIKRIKKIARKNIDFVKSIKGFNYSKAYLSDKVNQF